MNMLVSYMVIDAMMMAVILMFVAATVRLIGSNATNTFAAVGSYIAQLGGEAAHPLAFSRSVNYSH